MKTINKNKVLKNSISLVEILVLAAVIAILLAVSVPSYISMRNRANEARTEVEMENIVTAIEIYKADREEYPPSASGKQLFTVLSDYMEKIPESDYWGNDYVYINTGDGYTLSSGGVDGVIGTKNDIAFTNGKMTAFGRYPVRR
jgi:general secretion pathway protein G